jgi:PS-10 peptidase S37
VPGLTVVEKPELVPPSLAGYRFFYLSYQQPVDHFTAGGATFTQRLTLLHRDDGAPLVLSGSGYDMASEPTPSRSEPTRLLEANQLSIEHRYFGSSRPDPADWSFLDIEQAAADYHRVIQAGKQVYPGARVLVTGSSKGGEAAIFHRRFYPKDADGTIAYVTPLVRGEADARFPAFIQAITPSACAAERLAFQRRALSVWRPELLEQIEALVPFFTFEHLGVEKALEHAVLELPFVMWQYSDVVACDEIPGPDATAQEAFDFLDFHSGWFTYDDFTIASLAGYYYQSATELGYPLVSEAGLGDLLAFPGTDNAATYSPTGVPRIWDPNVIPDIQEWVRAEGRNLLLVYGQNDPWTAAAIDLGNASDSYAYVVPHGNHFSIIDWLPAAQRGAAEQTIRRWGGVITTTGSLAGRAGEPAAETPGRRR